MPEESTFELNFFIFFVVGCVDVLLAYFLQL